MPAEEEKPSTSIIVTRRALIASGAVLGVWGIGAAVVGALFAKNNNDNDNNAHRNTDNTSAPLEDDDTVLPESSIVRPGRAVPQGELATINCSSPTDTMGIVSIKGTVRLRITGSWLYESAEAFERLEGVSTTENDVDKMLIEEGEKARADLETNPEKAEEERQHRLWLWSKGEAKERVDDLQEEYSYLQKEFKYADDGSQIRFATTTQDLIDLGYKLISFDLEIENVDASDQADDPNLLNLSISLARGSDLALFVARYYLAEGENEPNVDTFQKSMRGYAYYVPQGERRRFHNVWAVSPRSLKGELSLFMGVPIWTPTLTDEVVLLAIDPEIVS